MTLSAEKLISFTSVPAAGWDGRAVGFRRVGDESGPVKKLAAMYPELDARLLDSSDLPIDHDLDKLILLVRSAADGDQQYTLDTQHQSPSRQRRPQRVAQRL